MPRNKGRGKKAAAAKGNRRKDNDVIAEFPSGKTYRVGVRMRKAGEIQEDISRRVILCSSAVLAVFGLSAAIMWSSREVGAATEYQFENSDSAVVNTAKIQVGDPFTSPPPSSFVKQDNPFAPDFGTDKAKARGNDSVF